MKDVKSAIRDVPNDVCPKELRAVLERWKINKASDAELIEASYYAQLDVVSAYRRSSLPTPPEGVRYRRDNPDVKMKEKDHENYVRNYAGFFAEEHSVLCTNRANQHALTELLAWAKAKPLPETICEAIRLRLQTHHDIPDDPPSVQAVRSVFGEVVA